MDQPAAAPADEPPPSGNPTIPHLASPTASSSSISDMTNPRHSKLHLLVVANGSRETAYCSAIAMRLSKDPKIAIRVVADDVAPQLNQNFAIERNYPIKIPDQSDERIRNIARHQHRAAELVEWADLMVLCPIDADHLAKMMSGHCDTMILEVLRSWDASKRILLVPGMSTTMWENPVTKRQISKLHRKWHWVRVLPPILWWYEHLDAPPYFKRIVEWTSLNEVLGIIKNQADLLTMGHDVDVPTRDLLVTSPPFSTTSSSSSSSGQDRKKQPVLPPEIWSLILEHTRDWELAQSLGIFTTLEMPEPWRNEPKDMADPLQVFMHRLEWQLLSADTAAICSVLETAPANLTDLSALAIKLIFKFALTDVLSYIERHCPIVFRNFDGKTIPTKASAYYGRTDILDWWARSPSFLEKQYDQEAMDNASLYGYIHVLEWWRRSGLPLKYSEAAMEQASAKGHIRVLDWWREAAMSTDGPVDNRDPEAKPVELKPGKSLLYAAQAGHTDVLRWWMGSGIAVEHQEEVCMKASRMGRTDVLETWRLLRGDNNLVFTSQVLVDPTIYSYIDVLEWWRKYARGELTGMDGQPAKKVEYRTMDIEEALEDSFGDQTAVRRWWAENGLNLGLGTSEWLKVRYL